MYTADQKNIGIPDILREVKVILMFKLMNKILFERAVVYNTMIK
jgi:hypothetical protein